ncbi:MAG: plasmid replication protein RepC [Rhizobiaceae bacterium]
METLGLTTPFGRRPLSLGQLAGQLVARECREDASADKWKLFRAVCEAKSMLGATDRALAVLSALLSFFPDNELTGQGSLIVFPSNQQLSLRAHGMAPATLRRHLAVLVECGLIVRRDSPNGKRFARRGQGDEIGQAFGFDLSPLLARSAEFERLAEEVTAERRALHLVRERLTLYRRDIAKMIAFGLEEAIEADWEALHGAFRATVMRIPRTATRQELEPLEAELKSLRSAIRNILETHVKAENPNANESQNERHKHDSNPDSIFDFEPRSGSEQGATAEPKPEPVEHPERVGDRKVPTGYPLGLVLRACPDIADYARTGISGWDDLVETANLVRAALGVSPDAWFQAREVLGDTDAAIVVAAILQRGEAISSAGGYLRALTDKARAGQFSIGPVLMALLRARGRSDERRTG